MIITIDGPSASGKSTIAQLLAKKLGFYYLDSGLLYRAVAYCACKNGEPSKNADGSYIIPDELIEQTSRLTYQYNNNHAQVFLDGTDLTNNLRTQECALAASRLSSNPRIRHGLMALQRSLGKQHDLVADGRDCGSVVYPHADIKFFLTAHLEIRAKRRLQDVLKKTPTATLEQIKTELADRDLRDRQRGVAPLVLPDGAIVVDNSTMNQEETVCYFLDQINKQEPNSHTHALHMSNGACR